MAITTDAAKRAMLAYHRFGLGPRPGGLARIAADPKAALLAELNTPGIAAITEPNLPTYAQACYEGALPVTIMGDRPEQMRKKEVFARVRKHLSVNIGFVERLVMFWSNHFSMSHLKGPATRATIGEWERDVLRKHVLGKYSDLLFHTIKHPAMINFLDNQSSTGPNSIYGYTRRVSYTENLAREILELHTLGSGNYPESDVAALAKILTGWSYVRGWEADNLKNGGTDANRGQFIFRRDWHEQGPIVFRGQIFPDDGQLRGERALRLIANHANTAQHLAFKMARHFIADEPTEAMVAPLRNAFLTNGGSLKAMAVALINLPEAWSTPPTKMRLPTEVVVGAMRAANMPMLTDDSYNMVGRALLDLRQKMWSAPSPEGYSDDLQTWLNPDAMTARIDVAQMMAGRAAAQGVTNVAALADGLFGLGLSFSTRERIMYAGNPRAQLTILFACPEFHRR
jgi:uncharacterized protein (DUF1800 family)